MRHIAFRAALVATAIAAATAAVPAHAGCNGVTNIFVWGCAPWDNNNGPRFPYYRKTVVEIPKNKAQLVSRNGSSAVLYNGSYYPLISQDGGGLVAAGGGNFRVYQQQ